MLQLAVVCHLTQRLFVVFYDTPTKTAPTITRSMHMFEGVLKYLPVQYLVLRHILVLFSVPLVKLSSLHYVAGAFEHSHRSILHEIESANSTRTSRLEIVAATGGEPGHPGMNSFHANPTRVRGEGARCPSPLRQHGRQQMIYCTWYERLRINSQKRA